MFGQTPRVGISSLLLDTALIDSLSTEAQLNRVTQYEGMVEAVDTDDDEASANAIQEEATFQAILNGEESATAGAAEAALDGEEAGVDGEQVEVRRDLFGATLASAGDGEHTNNGNEPSSNSDDNNLTLGELSSGAESRFNTTGDENFTAWQVLRDEMSDSTIINCEHLQQMKLRDKVPIVYCVNPQDISKMSSFVPAILVRVGKKQWEVMDENDENMEDKLEWDGDNGIVNMVGMYIKHPDKSFCDYFQSLHEGTKSIVQDDNEKDTPEKVTPRRSALRKRAHEQMSKAATSMKKNVMKRVGEDKVCEIGEVVHVPLKDMDKAKVDTGNLTGVIVQVDKGRSQARVAVKSGLLKSWYVYHRLGRMTGIGNNVELNGLTDALANWKTMSVISEREAARNESMVGGQGKGDVTCNCKGACNTNQCSCRKAGRICSSACHRNNFKCVNHDRGDK
jgi:hypothetical protein